MVAVGREDGTYGLGGTDYGGMLVCWEWGMLHRSASALIVSQTDSSSSVRGVLLGSTPMVQLDGAIAACTVVMWLRLDGCQPSFIQT